MNFSFAGSFNSRINYLLREIKGWTYGARGVFDGGRFEGPYTLYGGFRASATDSTLTEIFRELRKYTKEGITPGELTFTRNAMQQNDALKYESPLQKLFFIKRVLDFNLPKDYVAQQSRILSGIKLEEVNALAAKYLPHQSMVIVVVGDKETVFEKLKKLEFDVTEIEIEKL
jgi:zinc protease